jgi:diamine N-acetyltransferase
VYKYVLRQCGPGDEDALSVVARATILETHAPLVNAVELYRYIGQELSPERFRSFLSDTAMRLWAIEIEPTRTIVGYAHALPDEKEPSAMEIKRLYLFHRFRSDGQGKRLMDASIAFAREKGSQAMLSRVHHKNDDAIGFFLGYGFQSIGEELFSAADEMSKVFVMRLEFSNLGLQ